MMSEEERFQKAKVDLQDDSFLSAKVATITRKLIRDNPELDYQSAEEMALALLAYPLRGSMQLDENQLKDAISEMISRLTKYNARGLN